METAGVYTFCIPKGHRIIKCDIILLLDVTVQATKILCSAIIAW